jgi:hypothetical protein
MYKKLKDEKILDSVAGGLYTPAEKNQKGDFAMKDNSIMKKKILENFKQKKKFLPNKSCLFFNGVIR